MTTFADKVIDFNKNLHLSIDLPYGIRVMNPFKQNKLALEVSSAFYRKYYEDCRMRRLILGINPGRFGAGVTGVPFTDTKRLEKYCGIKVYQISTHEPSSVFIYEMINAYGGPKAFYSDFYINSPSPLGFLKTTDSGKHINYNYYDSKKLQDLLEGFIVRSIKDHISMGIKTDVAFCLGAGKNYNYLKRLNGKYSFFQTLIPLEHPRYIMQYKSKEKNLFISKYLEALRTKSTIR